MFSKILFSVAVASLFFGSAHAACYSSGSDWTGKSTVQCDDNTSYTIQRDRLLGTTVLRGYNGNTGATWSQKNTTDIWGKRQSGTDSQGNRYNCTLIYGRWSC